jgi:hypothetical protein
MSFIDSSNKRRRSPNYSPTTAAPSLRTPSPDYMPVSLQWRRRVQDARVVSTTLRLRPSPPRRATSPDYSPPSSPSNKCLAEHDATLCNFCSVTHSLDYAPSTQLPSLHARKVYAALVRCGGTVRSPEYVPSAKNADHVRSPDYTPVSRFWTSGGPTVSGLPALPLRAYTRKLRRRITHRGLVQHVQPRVTEREPPDAGHNSWPGRRHLASLVLFCFSDVSSV